MNESVSRVQLNLQFLLKHLHPLQSHGLDLILIGTEIKNRKKISEITEEESQGRSLEVH